MVTNPSIARSLQTVSAPNKATGIQRNNDVADNSDVSERSQSIGDIADKIDFKPATEGAGNFKQTFVSLAEADMKVSETEMIVYDGLYSRAQTELQKLRSGEAKSPEKAPASTEIKTEINDLGNAVFTTAAGYQIETDTNQGGHQTWIRNPEGETLAHIHGDPHVDLNADGQDDFHFGDNSSFMLEDGSEVFLNTKDVAGTEQAAGYNHDKIFITTGVYVKSGDNIAQTGEGTADDGVIEAGFQTDVDASELNVGTDADGAAVFGIGDDANAYIQDTEGEWNNLENESWEAYLADASFADQHGAAATDFTPGEPAETTEEAPVESETPVDNEAAPVDTGAELTCGS